MCRKLATLMLDAVKAQKASQDQPAVAMGTDQVGCYYKSSESLLRQVVQSHLIGDYATVRMSVTAQTV